MLITWNNALQVGQTINIFKEERHSPFTTASHNKYLTTWMENNQTNLHNHSDDGQFTYHSGLFSSYSSYAKSLDINGRIGASIGFIGAEASATWKQKENMNTKDMRLLVQANYKGKTRKNLRYSQQLQLNDIAKKDIQLMTFQQFKDKYGSHVIIGVNYGAKATYKMTYKYNSKFKYDYFNAKVTAIVAFVRIQVAQFHKDWTNKEVQVESIWEYDYEPATVLSYHNQSLVDNIHAYFSNNLKNAKKVETIAKQIADKNAELLCSGCFRYFVNVVSLFRDQFDENNKLKSFKKWYIECEFDSDALYYDLQNENESNIFEFFNSKYKNTQQFHYIKKTIQNGYKRYHKTRVKFEYRASNYSGIYGSYQLQSYNADYKPSFSSGIYGCYLYANKPVLHVQFKSILQSVPDDVFKQIVVYLCGYIKDWEALEDITCIGKQFQSEANKFVDSGATTNLMNNIRELLCNNCKPIQFVAIPIEMVECIHDGFVDIKQCITQCKINFVPFRELINRFFFLLKEFDEDLDQYSRQTYYNDKMLKKWRKNVDLKMEQLATIKTERDISSFMNKWKTFLLQQSMEYDHIKEEIKKPIYAIHNMHLKEQFHNDINI
eukprot:427413_1